MVNVLVGKCSDARATGRCTLSTCASLQQSHCRSLAWARGTPFRCLGFCGAVGHKDLLLNKYLLGSELPPALRACGAGGKEEPVVLRRRYCCKGYTSRSLRLCVCQTNSGSVKHLECQRRGVSMCIKLASGGNTASIIQDSFPTVFGQWLVLCNGVV